MAIAIYIGCGQRASQAEDLHLSGTFKQGGMVIGTVDPMARVVFQGREIEVFHDGRFLLGISRNAAPKADLQVHWPSGKLSSRTFDVAQRSYQVQHIRGVNPSHVDPPVTAQSRIAREQGEIRAARSADTNVAFFDVGWIWPVAGPITGVYGSDRIYNGSPGSPHWGLDIAAPMGTPILAPTAGVIRLVHQDNYFAGGLVILDHGYGLTSSFLHMASIAVAPGDFIKKGQVLGTVGSTGRSTGPHLDWRLNLGPDLRLDVALLPLPAMAAP